MYCMPPPTPPPLPNTVSQILTLPIAQEQKSPCRKPPSYSCQDVGGTTGNLLLVFIANRRSKVIDVTFTQLPLGRCTGNPAHTNKLQSAAGTVGVEGWVGEDNTRARVKWKVSGAKKGKPQTACLPAALRIAPTSLFTSSRLTC